MVAISHQSRVYRLQDTKARRKRMSRNQSCRLGISTISPDGLQNTTKQYHDELLDNIKSIEADYQKTLIPAYQIDGVAMWLAARMLGKPKNFTSSFALSPTSQQRPASSTTQLDVFSTDVRCCKRCRLLTANENPLHLETWSAATIVHFSPSLTAKRTQPRLDCAYTRQKNGRAGN